MRYNSEPNDKWKKFQGIKGKEVEKTTPEIFCMTQPIVKCK